MTAEADAQPCLSLPGFGLRINTLSHWTRKDGGDRLPHAISDWFTSNGITLRERRMLDFINQITDKPEWTRKVFDEAITAKWKEESIRWVDSLPESGDWFLSEKMFEVCIKELQEKAKVYDENDWVAILDAEATIVKSDSIVSEALLKELADAALPLENVPEKLKDWHPGSDGKVLDLVHPSLFPVAYGMTRALPTGTVPLENCISYIGKGELTKGFPAQEHHIPMSFCSLAFIPRGWGNFQWLPSHIKFLDDGTPVIDSYINNLHPQRHPKLYHVLAKFVDAAIPLWNECISWYHNRIRIPIETTGDYDYEMPEGAKFPRDEYRGRMEVDQDESPDPDRPDEDEMEDEEWAEENGCEDEYYEWRDSNRKLGFPEPEYIPQVDMRDRPGARLINIKNDFKSQGLQVIFKLANIHLTPEKPRYEGGTWHVEGSLNERICATALFYYDCENVTESRLAFRQSYDEETMIMKPAQSEYNSALAYYGIEQDGSTLLELGSVLTRQGRLLAFPNIIQHQVQSFELADKTKPGHRKILAMFLVDPHSPILSTANVPPQRRDWWSEEVRKIGPFAALPQELFGMIIDCVELFPMSWEQAVIIRDKVMEERGGINDGIEEGLQEPTFSFCEH